MASKTDLEKAQNLREEIQRKMQETVRKMVMKDTQAAYENYSSIIKNYRTTPDKLEKEHGFKASRDVLMAMGILPANTQSISIQNITNKQTNIISPVVSALIDKHLRLKPQEVIDVEGSDLDAEGDESGAVVSEVEEKGEEQG